MHKGRAAEQWGEAGVPFHGNTKISPNLLYLFRILIIICVIVIFLLPLNF